VASPRLRAAGQQDRRLSGRAKIPFENRQNGIQVRELEVVLLETSPSLPEVSLREASAGAGLEVLLESIRFGFTGEL
jgi:hypothetical protein